MAGFTDEHAALLDRPDFYGNNAWARNSQSEVVMPMLLGELHEAGLDLDRAKDALESIGYSKADLHQLDRWESKRTTGIMWNLFCQVRQSRNAHG